MRHHLYAGVPTLVLTSRAEFCLGRGGKTPHSLAGHVYREIRILTLVTVGIGPSFSSGAMKKRVVVVDDQEAVRELLCRYLEASSEYEVVGQARTGLEAIRLLKKTVASVAIIDLILPELCGHEVIVRLRREIPELRIVVFTGASDTSLLACALRSQPDGIVHKSEPLEILLCALRTASFGGRFLSPKTKHFVASSEFRPRQSLSTREIEVLQSIAEGKSNKEIGRLLGVATKTVDNHRTRLMQKLGVHNTASLTLAAVQLGIAPAGLTISTNGSPAHRFVCPRSSVKANTPAPKTPSGPKEARSITKVRSHQRHGASVDALLDAGVQPRVHVA
jgi:DNA-binding NarL/FixJ family response regulator